jgi:hypothetical protein
MSYGSTAFASAPYASLPASQGAFFTPSEFLSAGIYRRILEYAGSAQFFQVETRMDFESDEPLRFMRIYSHNDPNETPQLQVSVGVESFYTQSIIGAARFIVVELELSATLNPISITITGNEYFQ